MATNLHFVPARTKGEENPVLNGFRYFLVRSRDERSYWKCCCYKTHSCKARITTVDKQLTSPVPDHSHDIQNAEIAVHVAKQNLKRKAAESNLPTRFLAPQVSCGLSQESRYEAQLQRILEKYDTMDYLNALNFVCCVMI